MKYYAILPFDFHFKSLKVEKISPFLNSSMINRYQPAQGHTIKWESQDSSVNLYDSNLDGCQNI